MRKSPKDLVSGAEGIKSQATLAKARDETVRWKHRHGLAVQECVVLEKRLDALLAISEKPKQRKLKTPKEKKQKTVAAVIPATDWHVEERVTLEATNGKNQFSLHEAEVRINRFYNGAIEAIDWQSSRKSVDEIWHPMLGDLLSGYIHEELMESNECSPTEACVFLQEMITSGIDMLRSATRLPVFVPTCVGNHSRTNTGRKRIKTSCANSYEWLLYKTLEKYYEKDVNVHWYVGSGYHNIQTIKGRKVRFHHGDGLRYNGGVGGISIPVNKSIAQWQKVNTVDFDIFGHWHQLLWHYPGWVCCPSLIGYSEFSVEIKAEFQHPAQAFIVIDRDYGIDLATPIYLTDPARVKENNENTRFRREN